MNDDQGSKVPEPAPEDPMRDAGSQERQAAGDTGTKHRPTIVGIGASAGGLGALKTFFQHVPPDEIRRAFGPVVDRLAANGIDLDRQPIEVAPIAHYHMGGIRVDEALETRVAGLFACGEAIGGANGANRLSGNAITETFVFGARAGHHAALHAARQRTSSADVPSSAIDLLSSAERRDAPNTAAVLASLQSLMAENVGPFRTDDKLRIAISRLAEIRRDIGDRPLISSSGGFDPVLIDWLDLRNMLLVAQTVALPALARTESRGAHQREDYPSLDDDWEFNQIVELTNDGLSIRASKERIAA